MATSEDGDELEDSYWDGEDEGYEPPKPPKSWYMILVSNPGIGKYFMKSGTYEGMDVVAVFPTPQEAHYYAQNCLRKGLEYTLTIAKFPAQVKL